MNSKQRVRTALSHRQPDRVPIDYYARAEITDQLKKRLGLGASDSLEAYLGVDLRPVGPEIKRQADPLCYADPTAAVTTDGLYRDIWGVGFRANPTSVGFYMDLADSPLRSLPADAGLDWLDDYPWPAADLWDYSAIADQAGASRDYWVWAHSRGMFEISWFMRGFDEFLLDMSIAPERAGAILDRVQAYLMERTRRILDAGRGLIDMIEYNDDVGSQNGLLISPAMWRRFIKPRMVEFIRLCKPYGVTVRYHSCGGIRPIIADLIDIGVDVLNPVQTAARGMDAEGLKRDFGDRLSFNGGIDTQDLLPHASVDVVRRETQRLIDILGRDGGLILAPSHVYQADVPIDNVLAVYEVALGRTL